MVDGVHARPEDGEELYLARNLRLLRAWKGLTQKEMAALLHVERSAYTYYELGKADPSYHTLLKMASIFGTTVDTLLAVDIPERLERLIAPNNTIDTMEP